MSEVQQDADVGQPDLLDAEQGAGHRVERHVHAGLARLVLDDELQVRVFAGELADAVQRRLPQGAVIDLEGVVPAVLPRPQLDVVGAEVADDVGGPGDQVVRLPPDARVGVGEGTLGERAGVDLRCDADDVESVLVERRLDLLVGELTAEVGPVQVDHRQVVHLAGQFDRVEDGAGRTVAIGRVAVHVGGEVPDSGPVALLPAHLHSGLNRNSYLTIDALILRIVSIEGNGFGRQLSMPSYRKSAKLTSPLTA
jgi:hypothetical protein